MNLCPSLERIVPGTVFLFIPQKAGIRERQESAVIEISHLTKIFECKDHRVTALEDVNLNIEKGEIFGIIGMSGAGKSTLLRCLTLLERPTSGGISMDGHNIAALSGAQLRNARRKMGVVFQGYNLLMQKTVFENIAFPLKLEKKLKKPEIEARVTELLKIVGLEDRRNAYPAQLSGGQKQRVAIARALATNPEMLLCDEPTSALDPLTTKAMLKLLGDINKQLGVTIIIITHELAVVKAICSHVAVISDGKLAESGVVEEVFRAPKSDVTRQLIGMEG